MKKLENLQRQLSEGRINRREFIKRATSLGLVGAIPSFLLAKEALASTPKRGGRLRQAIRGGSTSDTLFGVLGGGGRHQVNTQWQILNNLTEIKPDGNVTGELAESWEASDDASEWVFKLRKGVEFHNGKTLDAADVVHSINVHRGENTKSTGKGLVAAVVDVKADGKDTVVFKLQAGNADFPMALSDYHFPICPAGFTDEEWAKGIGTGPFILTDWDPGVRSATRRNPNYFKEGKPYFDEVETINVFDVIGRENALRSGEVDVCDEPQLNTVHLFAKTQGIAVHEVGGFTHYTYPMLMDQAPFDNADVRSAMKLAIDRQVMLETILAGHGYLGNDHPIPKTQRYFASELPQRQYDPDRAKYHLKKAGLSSLNVTMHAADMFVGGIDSAILFKEQAAKAGININVKRVPQDGYWSEVWNKVPLCVSTWSGRPTEDMMLTTAFSATSAWNETHWKHKHFEKVLIEARAELDEIKRRDMYVELQTILHNEGGLIAHVFANHLFATSDKVRVPDTMSGNRGLDGDKNIERWSFA